MEKIININFQGRVIPIEEGAYDNLKTYIDGLRRHFATEESSDEIMSDIENRIAELLSDRLKRGAPCIMNSDVTAVTDSIGKVEDIEAAEAEANVPPKSSAGQPLSSGPVLRERFYRNADDKVIAGVCSGIAVRTGIDPIVVRILFVLLSGALFWVYVLLWIIVPSKSLQSNITRRLYRNPNDKVISGVCGGLAVYFRTEAWIVRLIFVLPLIVGGLSHGFDAFSWPGATVYTGSFGSTFFILYVVLWIALPYASSATDHMEMRGEKIDINSIKAATQAKTYSSVGKAGSSFGRIIGILFKSFFMLIAGVMAMALFAVLVALVFTGFVAMPFTNFVLDGSVQNELAWIGLVLFLGIPLLAFITWMVRRLIGVRSHRHYLGYIFAVLWAAGFISVVALGGMLASNFSYRSMVEEPCPMPHPSVNSLYVNVHNDAGMWLHNHKGRWFADGDNSDMPFHLVDNGTLWLNTVKVSVTQSTDSQFHIYEARISRGYSSAKARELADHISFPVEQHDSIVTLPAGFTISNKDKFRNQQVLITIEVPVGKTIRFNKDVNDYNWFNINVNGEKRFYFEHNRVYYSGYHANAPYTMTAAGLRNALDSNDKKGDEDDDGDGD